MAQQPINDLIRLAACRHAREYCQRALDPNAHLIEENTIMLAAISARIGEHDGVRAKEFKEAARTSGLLTPPTDMVWYEGGVKEDEQGRKI